MWNLKNDRNELIHKTEIHSHRLQKQTYDYQKGKKGEGRDKLGWD